MSEIDGEQIPADMIRESWLHVVKNLLVTYPAGIAIRKYAQYADACTTPYWAFVRSNES